MTDTRIEQFVQTTVSLQDAYQYDSVDKTFSFYQQSDLQRSESDILTMCSIGITDPIFCKRSGHNTLQHTDLIPISKLPEYNKNDVQFIGIINDIRCQSVNETPPNTSTTITICINCITNGSMKFNTSACTEKDNGDIYVHNIRIGKRSVLFTDIIDLCL